MYCEIEKDCSKEKGIVKGGGRNEGRERKKLENVDKMKTELCELKRDRDLK